jgi:hypothetical protein
MPRTYLQKDRCKFSIGVLSIKLNLKFYYENLINNKLSILDQKSKLYLFSNLKQNLVKENVSRHLYTYSVSINVALLEYLNVSPFLLIGSVH